MVVVVVAYEAGVFEAGDNFWREGSRDVRVGCGGGGFVAERRMIVFHIEYSSGVYRSIGV